ncbi:MAG: TolC family protein, partial [Spirochaetia bacterium]
PQWGVSAGLEFSLNLNVALVKAIESTRKAWQAEEISYKQAEAELEKDVRKSFYNLLLMQEERKLQVERIETARERYEQAQINYENGLVPELTVLNAEVAYENQKPALEAMDLRYRQALQGFKMNLGIDLRREISLEGSIEAEPVQLDAEELVNRYIGRRYDVRSMIANIKTMEDQYTANKLRAVTPTVSLGLNFDPSFQGDPWSDPWFSDIPEDWNQRSGMFRFTISMSLDGLLPFSETQVGLRELEDNIRKTRIGMQQALRGAEMEIWNTVDQIEKSRDTLETLQLNVRRAEKAYEMAEEAYNVGSEELLEVKDAQDELQKAQFEVLKEKYNYVSALLDLEHAINASVDEAAE